MNQPTTQELRQKAYNRLHSILSKYMDATPRDLAVFSCWLISVLNHNKFPTFPYLYLNAMKGSGKSRFLKLAAHLVDGKHTMSLTPAVLFRTKGPLMIDEAESLSSKEKADLRELLNAAYKKGMKVMRAKKIERTGETVIDEHDSYRAVCLANINGVDDVLEDRCIKRTLEKSFNKEITRRIELFDLDPDIQAWFYERVVFLDSVEEDQKVSRGSRGSGDERGLEIIEDVVGKLVEYYNGVTYVVPTTATTATAPTIVLSPQVLQALPETDLFSDNEKTAAKIYNRINNTEIQGRELELWLPLLVSAALVSDDLLEEIVQAALEQLVDRTSTNANENRDVVLIGFLSSMLVDEQEGAWLPLSTIVNKYKTQCPDDEKWFTPQWVAKALERNKLVQDKRRLNGARQIILNFQKVAEKAKQFGVDNEIKPLKLG